MKEHPILFSGPMVAAILAGNKTQTRRVIKNEVSIEEDDPYPYSFRRRDGLWDSFQSVEKLVAHHCPYGQVGDRLWVRETWAALGTDSAYRRCQIAYRADGELSPLSLLHPMLVPVEAWPRAVQLLSRRWRPSIHMPRWASRITLEIVGIKVERVQDISEDDAHAEGVGTAVWPSLYGVDEMATVSLCQPMRACYRNAFATLWDSINANRGIGWAANPWVWAITFEKVQP